MVLAVGNCIRAAYFAAQYLYFPTDYFEFSNIRNYDTPYNATLVIRRTCKEVSRDCQYGISQSCCPIPGRCLASQRPAILDFRQETRLSAPDKLHPLGNCAFCCTSGVTPDSDNCHTHGSSGCGSGQTNYHCDDAHRRV